MDTTEFIHYANEQLAPEGLHVAMHNEAGWYTKVYDENGEIVTVWVTDETEEEEQEEW